MRTGNSLSLHQFFCFVHDFSQVHNSNKAMVTCGLCYDSACTYLWLWKTKRMSVLEHRFWDHVQFFRESFWWIIVDFSSNRWPQKLWFLKNKWKMLSSYDHKHWNYATPGTCCEISTLRRKYTQQKVLYTAKSFIHSQKIMDECWSMFMDERTWDYVLNK